MNETTLNNDMKSFSEAFEKFTIQISPRFLGYRPKHAIHVDSGSFILKTATTMDQLTEVFRLRYINFLEHVDDNDESYDLDEFDHICDHLVIEDKATGKIVGTYRLLCSLYTSRFYSQGEFELDEFLKTDGVKLELGRACIDSNYRNGSVIDLLWRGIAEYSFLTNAKYFFGCSSIHTVQEQTAFNLYEYLVSKGLCEEKFGIKPTQDFEMDFSKCHSDSVMDMKKLIPPLLRSYMTAGSRVIGRPALDKEFECIDFMTVMDLDNLTSMYKRRYFSR